MALYVEQDHVTHVKQQPAFESIYHPGKKVPHSGIYRCVNCGHEDCCNKGDPFPPQNKHQHVSALPIGWQLLVFAQKKD
jgi:hypothetical protein